MHHGKRAFFFALVLTAAFASAAQAQTMSYRFKEGERHHYLLEQKTRSLMSLAGADIDMKVNVTMSMAWHVLQVDSKGNAQVKVKVIHSKMSMDSLLGQVEVDSKDKELPNDVAAKMIGQMNRAIAAMEITGTMLPTGEMKDVKVSEATVKAMQAIPGANQLGDLSHPDNFKDMISGIIFPTEAVAKGKSWSYKTETKSPSGKITSENVYTPEGSEVRDGATLEKIAYNPNIKIDADPKAQMKIKTIKATGHTFFDNKAGRVVESVVNQTKTGSVNVMGLTLDQITTETTTIRLQKPSEVAKATPGKNVESIKLNEDDFVDKVVFTEPLETLAGAAQSFTIQRGFERIVTITAPVGAPAALADEIKALVETSLGEKIGNRITVKESVKLDGDKLIKVNVQWIERSVRGTAMHSDGSTIMFQVKTGLRIKLEKAK